MRQWAFDQALGVRIQTWGHRREIIGEAVSDTTKREDTTRQEMFTTAERGVVANDEKGMDASMALSI